MEFVNAVIVGAGVVGLATAAALSKRLSNIIIIEKNDSFGEETSSRNSEVIHAGLYYPENSLKAKLCVQGKHKLYQYCQQQHIPHQKIGKLLVGHNQEEAAYLENLILVAAKNDVDDLTWLSQREIAHFSRELSATSALLSPSTGIIDSHAYMQSLLGEAEHNGALFIAKTVMVSAESVDDGFILTIDSLGEISELKCRYLINCAGLHSEQVANNITGLSTEFIPQLHWCRGHYFSYSGKSPFSKLIYPVPEANGLGIHASLDMGGQLKFGPDTEYVDELSYEFSANVKTKFVQAIKRYFPNLDTERLQPAYAGIRPKLQGPNDPFKDFVIQNETVHGLTGLINLFGIDSPGLTSSLAIADYVVENMHID
ncbi:NAD(P)/FAD-dependent oxidoreductase [Colwelliaceae bacterium 6471]